METQKKYQWGRKFALVGAIYGGSTVISGVQSSSSSTAALGYIVLPFAILACAIMFGFAGFCLSHFLRIKASKPIPMLAYILIVIAIGIPGFFAYIELLNAYLCQRTTYIRNLTAHGLEELMQDPPSNKFELAAITENQNITELMLDKIAKINNPDLYERQGAYWECINGKNRKGLAVMRLVALNPNVSASTLEYLAAHTHNEYVLGNIISNPKISDDTLRRVYEEFKLNSYPDLIYWGIAQNPNAPVDILTEMWNNTGEGYTRDYIKRNPKFTEISQ